MDNNCVFCNIEPKLVLARGNYATAITALYPIADYHILVMPNRHVADEKDLTGKEVLAIHMLKTFFADLLTKMTKKNYYFGFNGETVEKTMLGKIMHVHYHLVPLAKSNLEKSDVAKIIQKSMKTKNTEGLEDAYKMVTRRVSVRNIVPGMGDFSTRPIDARQDDASKWAKEIRAKVKNINLTDI